MIGIEIKDRKVTHPLDRVQDKVMEVLIKIKCPYPHKIVDLVV